MEPLAHLATHLDDRMVASGDGSRAMVLGLGVFVEQKSSQYFLNSGAPAARAILINSRQVSILPGIRSAPTTDIGAADAAFLRTMLSHARRETPAALSRLPAGVTDVRLFRVWVANGRNNIRLLAGVTGRQ